MHSRRAFLASGATAFPAIVPARVLGKFAPSNIIQVAQIGCGRIARGSEFPGILKHAGIARFVAVCDLDTFRLKDAKELIERTYTDKLGANTFTEVKTFGDYREMLADKSIDAVCISTPDHWHAQPAMEAALAGKDVYLQKPASLTIREGRQMAACLGKTGRILQIGSQQRSDARFRLACEYVRNGRIGKLREIFIGLPLDPSGEIEKEMPVPPNLNFDAWLGSTPLVFYTEKRVHPQSLDPEVRYGRPGWLRCEQFGAGMITGWGAHHIDIAHWAMDVEYSGPSHVEADCTFPKSGLWNVHGPFHVRLTYPNGVVVYLSDKYPNGLRFIGDDGWIWVTRGHYTARQRRDGLNASDARILEPIKDTEIHLHASPKDDHHLDWLMSIRTKQAPATNAEIGHRSCSACLVAYIAMKLGATLRWDATMERFSNSEAANAMLARSQRRPYGTDSV